MPAISVLLPVRDAEATLGACLASLAGQTLSDHEVVAVDDGSTDGTPALLAAAAARDPRLRVVRTGPRGLVAALNRALAEARAPLLARMDADDLAHPERLARQARRLREDPATDVLGCRVEAAGIDGGPVGPGMLAYVGWLNGLLDHEAIVRDLWVESPLVHPGVALRREALLALGGYREFEGPEDYDLWFRGCAAGWRFAKLPETLLIWRDRPRRLTRCDARYAPGRLLALKVEALDGLRVRGRPLVVWGAGPVGKAWARALLSRGRTLLAFVEVDPDKLGQVIHGAPVVAVAEAGGFPGALHLAAVGQRGARDRIRAAAAAQGLVDGVDLVAVS